MSEEDAGAAKENQGGQEHPRQAVVQFEETVKAGITLHLMQNATELQPQGFWETRISRILQL